MDGRAQTYEAWVSRLACALLGPCDDPALQYCYGVCAVKADFADAILPLILLFVSYRGTPGWARLCGGA